MPTAAEQRGQAADITLVIESVRRGQGLQVFPKYTFDIGKLPGVNKLDLTEAVDHDGRGGSNDAEFLGPAVAYSDAQ